jgi:IclR family transcriptional regulator, KDG regulon repressor
MIYCSNIQNIMDSTLAKGLNVLEWMTRQPNGCRVIDVAQTFGLARSNAHRTLQTLVECGWAMQDEGTSTYRSGLKLFELGSLVDQATDLKERLHPLLAQLAEQSGETIHLAVLDGAEVVYLDKFDSPLPVAAYSRVGGRAAAYCVAAGKALLASQALDEDLLKARLIELKPHTKNSFTDFEALEKELEKIRFLGYAENREEWRMGVCGLGSVVTNAAGKAVAAIGMSVPSIRFSKNQVTEHVTQLLHCVALANAILGSTSKLNSVKPHIAKQLPS